MVLKMQVSPVYKQEESGELLSMQGFSLQEIG